LSLSSLRSAALALWSLAKGGLMLAGLVALVGWEVETFGHSAPVAAPAAAKPQVAAIAAPQGLETVHPARVAESLAAESAAEAQAPGLRPDSAEERVALAAALGDPGQHRRIASYLSKKYQVSSEATQLIVSAAYMTGHDTGVDPTLILAVMAIESRFNPFAESGMGAQGLMQVIPKYHLDKFEELGGKEQVLNPVSNIKVGALILKDYISRFGGVEAGLKAYSGAAIAEDDAGYAAKVLGERERIRAAGGPAVKVRAAASTAKPVVSPNAGKIDET
jgi:soluble lytic murein transglycosylase-like protein